MGPWPRRSDDAPRRRRKAPKTNKRVDADYGVSQYSPSRVLCGHRLPPNASLVCASRWTDSPGWFQVVSRLVWPETDSESTE
jgi:hypothetical protein